MPDRKGSCMKPSIGIAAVVTALLAVLAISPPIPDAWAAVPASAPASRPASSPATQASADLPVGTLMPVAEIVKEGVFPSRVVGDGAACFYSKSWISAPDDTGVVNPRAVVCKLGDDPRYWSAGSAALDSLKPDDQAPNVVRVDVTGEYRFQNALVLPLRQDHFASYAAGPSIVYKTDPVAVNLELDGGTIPVMVRGVYNRPVPASQPSAEGGEHTLAVDFGGDLRL
jgi:hypothetical protein